MEIMKMRVKKITGRNPKVHVSRSIRGGSQPDGPPSLPHPGRHVCSGYGAVGDGEQMLRSLCWYVVWVVVECVM